MSILAMIIDSLDNNKLIFKTYEDAQNFLNELKLDNYKIVKDKSKEVYYLEEEDSK